MGTILKALIAAAAVVLEEILEDDQAAPFISCICNYLMQLKKQKKERILLWQQMLKVCFM